jgi:DNA-binding HxlR family transcriptional regulator/putative sterol carrier protein
VADKRHYGQFCGLAAGLDVVGERWTLLIVRELLISPARFGEIMENLPGIGPNLLSERLRSMTRHGLVEQSPVPGDARGKQYRLTPLGEDLRTPLLALARWGMYFLSEDDAVSGISRAAWGFLAVQAMIEGHHVPDVDESYEFRVDSEVFHIAVTGGQVATSRGPAADPVLVVITDADTFIRIGARMLTPFEAVVTGALEIGGDPLAVQRCIRLIGLETRAPTPA